MYSFNKKLLEIEQYPLKTDRLDTLVINLGLKKNLKSMYYYAEALAKGAEDMPLNVIERAIDILKAHREISMVEITGASPERNPHFKYLIKSVAEMGNKLAVVTNPAVYAEPGMEDLPSFLAEHKVKVLAFVPHYREDVVDSYMGKGTYNQIISSFKRLNDLGYGQESNSLTAAFVYLPPEPEPASCRNVLKDFFIRSFRDGHGIDFNHFIVFNTIPIGRFKREYYISALRDGFNIGTLKNLPCRHAVSIGPEGKFHDCDFLVAADVPVKCRSTDIDTFDYDLLSGREVATSDLCFICTAGEGATCAECFT